MQKNHCVECGISSSEVSVPVDHTESVQLREFMWVYISGDDMNGGYAYSHSLMWELPEILTYFYK